MTMVHSYEEAIRYLDNGRDRNSRPVANNTRAERRGDDVAIRLHATDVATIHPDNSVTLDSGGWLTVTTKDRMNAVLGWGRGIKIGSDRGAWFIYRVPGWEKVCRYFDGIRIAADNTILNPRDESLDQRIALAEDKMGRRINRFIDDYFAAMEAGKVPLPGGGDCWDCSMIVTDGPDKNKPLGDAKHNDPRHSHLLSHITERYYVPSLLWNAARARGYRDLTFVMSVRLDREAWEGEGLMKVRRGWQSDKPDTHSVKELRRDLRKYLRKHLVPTRATQ